MVLVSSKIFKIIGFFVFDKGIAWDLGTKMMPAVICFSNKRKYENFLLVFWSDPIFALNKQSISLFWYRFLILLIEIYGIIVIDPMKVNMGVLYNTDLFI